MANTLEFNVTVNTKGVAGGLKPVQTKLEQLRKTAEETRDAIVALGSTTDQSALSKLQAAASAYSSLAASLKKIAEVKPQSITAAKNSLLKLVEPAQRLSEASAGIGALSDALKTLSTTAGGLKGVEEAVKAADAIKPKTTKAKAKTPEAGPVEDVIARLKQFNEPDVTEGLDKVNASIASITDGINGLTGVTRKISDLATGLKKLPESLSGFVGRTRSGLVTKDFSVHIAALRDTLSEMSKLITTTGEGAVLSPEMANSIYKLGDGLKNLSKLKIDASFAANLRAVGSALHDFYGGFSADETGSATAVTDSFSKLSNGVNRLAAGFTALGKVDLSAGIGRLTGTMQSIANVATYADMDALGKTAETVQTLSGSMKTFAKTIKALEAADIEGGIGRVIGGLRALTDSSSGIDLGGIKDITSAISSVMRQINNISKLGENGEAVAAGMRVATNAMRELINTVSAFPEAEVAKVRVLADALDTVRRSGLKSAEAIRRVTGATKDTAKAATTAKGPLRKLGDQFMRILRYRVLRSVLMGIWRALKEGVTNLYQYSVAIGNIDTNQAQSSMDKLSTSALLMKNSLGSILMPIITAMVPVVQSIAHAFNQAANAIAAFFSALSGKSTFTGAIDLEKKFAKEANSGGKALERQLLAFDEINRLDDNKGGGSSKEVLDYSKMFDEFEVPESIAKFAERIADAFERIQEASEKIKNSTWFQTLKETLTERFAQILEIIADCFVVIADAIEGTDTGDYTQFWEDFNRLTADCAQLIEDLSLDLGTLTIDFLSPLAQKIDELTGSELYQWLQDIKTAAGENSDSWQGLLTKLLGVATIVGILLAFGHPIAAAVVSIVAGIALLISGLDDWIEKGTLSQDTANKLSAAFALIGIPIALLTGSWIPAVIAGVGILAVQIGANWDKISKKIGESRVAITEAAAGVWNDIKTGAGEAVNWVIRALNDGIRAINKFLDSINEILGTSLHINLLKEVEWGDATPKGFTHSSGNVPKKFASGGFPDAGSAFIAGEAGPEFVGNIGGRTGVVNTSEMADAVAAGNVEVVGAIVAMANAVTRAIENKDTDITLDGQSVARAIYPYTKDVTRISGSSFVKNGGLA